jgi:GxxExxY protein
MEYDATHLELLATAVVDAAFHVHRGLGPGLLESVYESVLARMLEERGYRVERQKVVSFEYCGMRFEDGFRADLVVEGAIVVELKSVERLAPVHAKQLLTYLRLLDLRVGFLINFNTATFKEGIQRVVNQHRENIPPLFRATPARSLPGNSA